MMAVLTKLDYSGLNADMVVHAFNDLYTEGWPFDSQASRIPDKAVITYELMTPMKPGSVHMGVDNKTTTIANAMHNGLDTLMRQGYSTAQLERFIGAMMQEQNFFDLDLDA